MTRTLVQIAQLLLGIWATAEWLRTLGRRKLIDPLGWCIATGAVASWTSGDIVRLAPLLGGHATGAVPLASHILAALWGLLCAWSAWRLAARQSRTARARFWIDGAMITTALLVVGWSAFFAPTLRTGTGHAEASWIYHAAVFSHGLGDLLMLSGVLMLCSRLPTLRSGPMLYMLLSQAAVFVGDLFYLLPQAHGLRHGVPLVAEISWTAGAIFFGLNARRLRSMLLLGVRPVAAPTAGQPVGRLGLTLPYLPLVGIIALSAVRAARHTMWSPAETWLSMVAVLVVMARQLLVLYDNRRLLEAVHEREQRLRHHAFHDPLTGLANRLLFGERLDDAVAELPATTDLAILFCDLDDFKRVNDHLGHAIGDRLLQVAAERLQMCAPDGAMVARLGGDEFALLLVGDSAGAEQVALRVMDAFAEPVDLDGEPLHVVVSVGIGRAGAGTISTARELLSQADLAMLTAKSQGKGRFAMFDPAMKPADLRDRRMVNDFAAALRDGQLTAVYQPIVELGTGRTVGLEALARWNHPERGAVPPERFIPLAEATGLIGALTEQMLTRLTHDHALWRECGAAVPFISLNVSPTVLLREEFSTAVSAAISSGLPAERLVLELTDGAPIPEGPSAESLLNELRATGVRLALDDFGAGRHTLMNLRRLPVDMIKVDRTIVAAADASERDHALLASYVAVGLTLGMAVIGSGVETVAQATRLRELGCVWGQGYHFARPMPADEILLRLQDVSCTTTSPASAPADALPNPRPESGAPFPANP